MNLNNIINTEYPNWTFHDAVIKSVHLDYIEKTVKIACLICIGDPDAIDEKTKELQAAGHLILTDLIYCIIEPPDLKQSHHLSSGLWITDDGSLEDEKRLKKTSLPYPLPEGAFAHYFFVNDWNSFIYIAAKGAYFEWD